MKNLKKYKEAYEVLSDDQKRAQYDQFGHTDPNQGFGGGGDFGGGLVVLKIFLVHSLVAVDGRRRDPNAPTTRCRFTIYNVTLEFEEAVFGKETEIEIPREETCDTCKDSGAKPGTKAKHVHIVMDLVN